MYGTSGVCPCHKSQLKCGGLLHGKRTAGLVLAQHDRHLAELANASLAHQFASRAQVMIAALPRAHLHDAAGFLDHLAKQLAFVDRERQRLFAVHVLAGAAGVDQHPRMPVIGRANHHHVNVGPLEQPTVVFKQLGLAAELLAGFFGDLAIDVGNGHHVSLGLRFVGDHRTLVTHANGANAETIVGRTGPQTLLGVGAEDVGRGQPGGRRRGGSTKEASSAELCRHRVSHHCFNSWSMIASAGSSLV